MMQSKLFQRAIYPIIILLIGALILGFIPGQPVQAALVEQRLDDALADFTGGTFQRTALSSLKTADPDQTGAVQLSRSGKLKSWVSLAGSLPEALTDIGAVALGNRIYVIGGSRGGTDSNNSNQVYYATIDPDTGTFASGTGGWQANPVVLPAVQSSNSSGCTAAVGPRSGVAAAAVSTGSNGGYIYVIGGSVFPSGCGFALSSYVVHIGTVNAATGQITWTQGPSLPATDDFGNADGLRFARAITINTGSKTFLYVIGGQSRFRGPLGADAYGSKKVFVAEVNTSNGTLSSWTEAASIPLPNNLSSDAGLWNATVVGGYFDGGGQGGYAIYVTGGEQQFTGTDAERYNTLVYRAIVNPSSGALTWSNTAGLGNSAASIPEPRIGMPAVELNGKLYLIAGRQPTGAGTLRSSVLTTYVQDDLSLPRFGDGTELVYFIDSPNVIDQRSNHATVIVPATPKPDEPSAAWVYAIGGTKDTGATSSIYYGKIGSVNESAEDALSPTGWYYSKPYSIVIGGNDAEVQEVRWTTVITRISGDTQSDIQLEYRVAATTGSCNGPSVFQSSPWRELDGSTGDSFRSKPGSNSVEFVGANKPPPSSCFQYRAKFTKLEANPASPSLLNVSILKIVPGSPDLKISELGYTTDSQNRLTEIKVSIKNENLFENPTQPANWENEGSFFVDLCISEANGTITLPPSSQGQVPACSKAYANINKREMTAGRTYAITANQWLNTATNQPINLLSLMSSPGTYQVAVVIDGQNFVNEGDKGGEGNNVSSILTITVAGSSNVIYMPLTRR